MKVFHKKEIKLIKKHISTKVKIRINFLAYRLLSMTNQISIVFKWPTSIHNRHFKKTRKITTGLTLRKQEATLMTIFRLL